MNDQKNTREFLRVHVPTKIADRAPLPDFLVGLLPESLKDLSWTDPGLGVVEYVWLPPNEQPAPAHNEETHTVTRDGETLSVDFLAGVVRVVPGIRPLTAEELAAEAAEQERQRIALIKHYDGLVQRRLDNGAQAFGYGDPNRPEVSPILHVISYADEPAVVKFQAEGRVWRACRSRTWVKCAEILDAVLAGQRPQPTEAELLAALDEAVPLPTEADVLAEIARLTA